MKLTHERYLTCLILAAWAVLTIAVFLLPGCGSAGRWTKKDTMLEIASEGLIAIDYHQTLQMADRPDRWRETNPLLGQHPSSATINQYMVLMMLLHPIVAYLLPGDLRTGLQIGTIATEGVFVERNRELGLKIGMGF